VILPSDISSRVQACVESQELVPFVVDPEVREHGSIVLMGTIGEIWTLRPDGTFWRFDEDMRVTPLPQELHLRAISWGKLNFPWLGALIPSRPAAAVDCPDCDGRGGFSNLAVCPMCSGTGWRDARAVV
jgi:hypothetical protein